MDRTTPQERRGYEGHLPHNDSSRRIAAACGGDGLRLRRSILIGVDRYDRDGDAL